MADDKAKAQSRPSGATPARDTSESASGTSKLYERRASGAHEWMDPNDKETRRQVESGEISEYTEDADNE